MARTHKFRLVLKGDVVHAQRPKGYRNLQASAAESESLIKSWNLKEGVPVHVFGQLYQNEYGVEMWQFYQLDPDPSVGY